MLISLCLIWGLRLEMIGEEYPNAGIIISRDVGPSDKLSANSGFVLVRNTPWARDFVMQWWSRCDRTKLDDQSALALLHSELSILQKAEVISEKIMYLRVDAVNTNFPARIYQVRVKGVNDKYVGLMQCYRCCTWRVVLRSAVH